MKRRDFIFGLGTSALLLAFPRKLDGKPQEPQSQDVQATIPLREMMSLPLPQRDMLTPESLFSLDGLNVHFDMEDLVRHVKHYEGLKLYPYKDSMHIATIGYGFNMEKTAIDHPGDPYSYNAKRLDPSGHDIWKLSGIPENYDAVLESANTKSIAARLKISQESADILFNASILQAIHNAGAYFRHFNEMPAKQQMMAVDLVYNMGTNLEHHPDFLAAANAEGGPDWKRMRHELEAMGYRHSDRARKILAAFDPLPERTHHASAHRHGVLEAKRAGHRHSHPTVALLENGNDGGRGV